MTMDVCPRCEVETKDLHEDDGLCPKCEGEWVESYTALFAGIGDNADVLEYMDKRFLCTISK